MGEGVYPPHPAERTPAASVFGRRCKISKLVSRLPCNADSATTKRADEFCTRRKGCQQRLALFADDSLPNTSTTV